MSGHSKWSTIKRQKQANDQARGKLFSKLSRAISVAVKTGGGPNMDSNYKLKMAIEQAKQSNMPKDNIDRAIARASGEGDNLEEIVYEGFGPGGVQVIVDATTDNKNRTGQELKNIFDKSGGNMGGPNSVAFNFDMKGYLLVDNGKPHEEQMLKLIDLHVDDIDESSEGIEVYVSAKDFIDTKERLEKNGFKIISGELIRKPKTLTDVDDPAEAKKIMNLLTALDEHDDVSSVNSNADIDDKLI